MSAKPFIKWAGGKGKLLPQLEAALPQRLYEEEFTYIEPFVGGGAMLFFMLQKFPNIKKVVINDINKKLTEAYKTIKENPKELIYCLKHIEQQYLTIQDYEEQRLYYLEMRRRFNEEQLPPIDKTTILIFLNRTCFNGLYRENSKGQFNVPFGRYTNPSICNEELIYADSELLNQFDVQITTGDFENTISLIDNNGLNFFYFDPPYRPLSATSNLNTYVKEEFNDEAQGRLRYFCHKITEKGGLFLQSNSDPHNVNVKDDFFDKLYANYHISRISATRSVNSKPDKRGKINELLIDNYILKDYIPTYFGDDSFRIVGTIERKVDIKKLRIDKKRLSYANPIYAETVNNIVNNFHIEGWEPIWVDDEYCIRDGQHRYTAAKKMKLKYVDVLMLNYETLANDNYNSEYYKLKYIEQKSQKKL